MFPLSIIIAVAGSHQIFEWIYAVSVDTTAGTAVPGSQGEPRDAQKDRFAGTLGAVAALLLFYRVYRNPLPPPARLSQPVVCR